MKEFTINVRRVICVKPSEVIIVVLLVLTALFLFPDEEQPTTVTVIATYAAHAALAGAFGN